MTLYENELYMDDVKRIACISFPWDKLCNTSILISGACGLLGSFLIDVLLYRIKLGLTCNVYAIGRDDKKFKKRFCISDSSPNLHFIKHDVTQPLLHQTKSPVSYVLHLASNTHPLLYAADPIGTITTNIIGLLNLLNYSTSINANRFVFASSCEIYGETRNDVEKFSEEYCGYINSNTLRAGYPESKRCGESLCQAFKSQKTLDVVIPRFSRLFGPTMQLSDSKAISQFIKNGLSHSNIVLKSSGNQYYSYTYVADAISGLLYTMFYGKSGDAYNIASDTGNVTLKELAKLIADKTNTTVVYDIPDKFESSGYSTATKSILDSYKITQLGWVPQYGIKDGIVRTLQILQEVR